MTDIEFWPKTGAAVAAETVAATVAWRAALAAHAVREDWTEVAMALGILCAVAEAAAGETRGAAWPQDGLPEPNAALCEQFFKWVERQAAQFDLAAVSNAAGDVAQAAARLKG